MSNPEPYSDASSTYWPPGWNWSRYSDPEADMSTVPADQMDKLRNGLRQVLGDEGMHNLAMHLRQKHQDHEAAKLNEQGVPPPAYNPPDFLKQWKKRRPDGRGLGLRPWGLVAYRTALYDNEALWSEFKSRVERILHVPFDKVVAQHRGHQHEEVAAARGSFSLDWVEDERFGGADAQLLRENYAARPGMKHGLFLCASPEAVRSVLSLEEGEVPTAKARYWRDDAPFLLVVMEQDAVNPHGEEEGKGDGEGEGDRGMHDESTWFKPVWKVPVEIVPDVLWDLVDRDFVQPARMTRLVRGSGELGGMEGTAKGDGLSELWWGMGPSPESLRRRRALRGF